MGWPSGVVGEAEREGDGRLTMFDRGGSMFDRGFISLGC